MIRWYFTSGIILFGVNPQRNGGSSLFSGSKKYHLAVMNTLESRLQRWFPENSTRNRLMVVLAFVGLFFLTLTPVRSNDIWWHLETGRRLWSTHHFLKQDPYSWTMRGASWINGEWLFQIGLYAVYVAGGWVCVILAKSFCILTILACPWLTVRRSGASPWLATAAAIWVFYAARPGWTERADLLSVMAFGFLLMSLAEADRDAADSSRRWLVWPLVFVIWVNTHGGFALGLASLFLWAAGRRMDHHPLPPRFGWILAACIIATLLNPYGPDMHLFIGRVSWLAQRSPATEWTHPPWNKMWWMFWLTLALCGLELLASHGKRWRWAVILILVATAFGTVRHRRYVPFFVLSAVPFLAASPVAGFTKRWNGLLTVFSLPVLFLWSVQGARGIEGGISSMITTRGAMDYIEQRHVAGPFYNDWELGSYWIWRFKGEPGDFLDGRSGAVEGFTALREAAMRAKLGGPRVWQSFLQRYGVRSALICMPEPSAASLMPYYFPPEKWKLLYSDEQALLFTRNYSRKRLGPLTQGLPRS